MTDFYIHGHIYIIYKGLKAVKVKVHLVRSAKPCVLCAPRKSLIIHEVWSLNLLLPRYVYLHCFIPDINSIPMKKAIDNSRMIFGDMVIVSMMHNICLSTKLLIKYAHAWNNKRSSWNTLMKQTTHVGRNGIQQ